MGYYTDFTLHVEDPAGTAPTGNEIKLGNYTLYKSPITKAYHTNAKWYNYETDMIEFSKHYPELTFTLKGVGEEPGDEWVMYFKAGKSVKHMRNDWTPPPFNESALR